MDPRGGIASSHVFSMFPTFVWQVELADAARALVAQQIGGWIDQAVATMPARGESWQSDPRLQGLEPFGDLMRAVDDLVRVVLEFLKIGHDGCHVTGCWVNVNARGTGHRTHAHPNNFLSGVYYLKVPPGADTINFHDPRPQARVIRPPVTDLAGENTDQVVVRVRPGSLLLFPSWLEHSVDRNDSDEPRISVSFNLMFARYAEAMSAPMWSGGKRS